MWVSASFRVFICILSFYFVSFKLVITKQVDKMLDRTVRGALAKLKSQLKMFACFAVEYSQKQMQTICLLSFPVTTLSRNLLVS